jgi:GNAT superfamily N-acetyltransferase
MEIRTLARGEREKLLELLDGWPLADGWRGRDFFWRYVERDPTFADENVWVALEDGRLLSCVQIFPRAIRMAGTEVPAGGIGTVFTREGARRRGLAERLMERACESMRARGLAVSLLFGVQPLYRRQGYEFWPAHAGLLLRAKDDAGANARSAARPPPRAAAGLAPGLTVDAFEPARDLAALRALHAAYSGLLAGTVVRDEALWAHSLANAGNPSEEFLVARAGGELVAYARACVLSGFLNLMEFGCVPGFEDALAALVAGLGRERADDALAARAGKTSAELRHMMVSAPLQRFAPDLAVALAQAGFELREIPLRNCMLRCLDPAALAARVGVTARSGETPNGFLARLLPADELVFWTADRF